MREDSSFALDNIQRRLYYLLLLFLPTQLGYHFWPHFSFIQGLRIDYLSPIFYLTDLIILALVITSILDDKNKIQVFIKKHLKSSLFIALLFFLLTLRLLISQNFWAGIYELIKVFEMVFVFFYSAKFIVQKEVRKNIVIYFAIPILIEVILAILQLHYQKSIGGLLYFLGERFFTAETPGIANAAINNSLVLRPYATFPHPNVFAGYLLLSQVILLGIIKGLKKKAFYLTVTAVIFCSIGIALSLSRVAIVLEAFILIYYIVLLFKKMKKSIRKVNLIIISMLTFFTLSLITIPRVLSTSSTEEALTQRSSLIKSSLIMIVKSPLTGVGLNNFLNKLAVIKDPKTPLQPVHNIPLLLAAELGIPVALGILLLYLFLLKIVLVKNHNVGVSRQERIVLFILISVLGLLDHYFRTIQQGQLILAVVLGFIYSSKRNNSKLKRSNMI